jgi:hypothetical protein
MGLFSGLFFAFCFYAFLYLTRESFRLVSLTEDYDLWILTDKEVSFYNLIFAFISVIFAQSICFSFWFDKPQKLFSKRKFQNITIVNDQRALNTYFLAWSSKLALVFVLFFGLTSKGGFYVFSFYPEYNYIFVLIILVLFLQTWNSIRRINKRHSLKWMFISMIIVSTIAFGLSKVNLIDYKSINNIALQKNIPLKYNLEVPESNCYEIKLENRSLTKDVYVVRNKQIENSIPQIFINNEEVTLKGLGLKILDLQSSVNENDINLCTYHMHIDKTIKMNFLNELKKEMANVNALRIAYAIVPTNAQYDKRYYKDYTFKIRLPKYDFENYTLLDRYKGLDEFENIIEIRNTNSGEFEINGITYSVGSLKQVIKEDIIRNPNYIVKFYINDNVDFSVYLSVMSKTKEAVDELRNEYSFLTYSKSFDNLNDEQTNETNKKYGFRVFEITSEMKKQLED